MPRLFFKEKMLMKMDKKELIKMIFGLSMDDTNRQKIRDKIFVKLDREVL